MAARPIDPRTLFPRTCTGCGIPQARDAFPLSTKQHPHRRCHDCLVQEQAARNARRTFGAWSRGEADAAGRVPPLDPMSLFPRRCSLCGTPKSRDDFRTARGAAKRRCLDCERADEKRQREADLEWARAEDRRKYAANAERRRKSSQRWREANLKQAREKDKRHRDSNLERERAEDRRLAAEVHAETRERAHHHGDEWTGAEMEVADRRHLSAREVAIMLGRTHYAVKHIRRKIDERDPRTLMKLGYDPAEDAERVEHYRSTVASKDDSSPAFNAWANGSRGN